MLENRPKKGDDTSYISKATPLRVNNGVNKFEALIQGIHDRVSAYVLLKVEKQT